MEIEHVFGPVWHITLRKRTHVVNLADHVDEETGEVHPSCSCELFVAKSRSSVGDCCTTYRCEHISTVSGYAESLAKNVSMDEVRAHISNIVDQFRRSQ